MQNNWVGVLDTAIQYYLHRDASALTDEEWAETIAQLTFLRGQERDAGEAAGWRQNAAGTGDGWDYL